MAKLINTAIEASGSYVVTLSHKELSHLNQITGAQTCIDCNAAKLLYCSQLCYVELCVSNTYPASEVVR